MVAVEVYGIIHFETRDGAKVWRTDEGPFPQRAKFHKVLLTGIVGDFVTWDSAKGIIDIKVENGRAIYRFVEEDGDVVTGNLVYEDVYR